MLCARAGVLYTFNAQCRAERWGHTRTRTGGRLTALCLPEDKRMPCGCMSCNARAGLKSHGGAVLCCKGRRSDDRAESCMLLLGPRNPVKLAQPGSSTFSQLAIHRMQVCAPAVGHIICYCGCMSVQRCCYTMVLATGDLSVPAVQKHFLEHQLEQRTCAYR